VPLTREQDQLGLDASGEQPRVRVTALLRRHVGVLVAVHEQRGYARTGQVGQRRELPQQRLVDARVAVLRAGGVGDRRLGAGEETG